MRRFRNDWYWPEGRIRGDENGEWEEGRNGKPRNPTEPHGAPRNANKRELRPKIQRFIGVFPILLFSISPCTPPPLPQLLTFRWFRNAWYWLVVEYRSEGPENGRMGTMDNRGTPRNPEENHKRELRPQIHFFRRFRPFDPHVPPFLFHWADIPHFGGFETPGIGWRAGYRGEEKGQRAKWATAELGDTPRNHGQWEDRQNEPPRQLAEPHGT